MCVCVCVCVCVLTKNGVVDISDLSSFASIQHRNTIIFDSRKTLYLKEPPAKLLKTYLKDNGNICFVVIQEISVWLNYCWKLNQVFPVAKLALKVDVNLLNHPCKPAEWLADWLTDILWHLDSQGTRALEGHLGTRTLKALGHSVTRKALGHSKHSSHFI